MKTCSKILVVLGIWGWVIPSAFGAEIARADVSPAIQAIQQAPDPSAVVTAYANGIAVDPNNPKLYNAYVARMVDLGLPEMAYHQAETLTSMESNNGLAWGVVAYVDARRGQMPEAMSAIILSGQFAPDNKFIQRTAGEIVAWYDLKADKNTLADNTRDGVAKVRALLSARTDFLQAYDTARKAYQAQYSPPATQPAPAQPPPTAPVTPQTSYVPSAEGYYPPPDGGYSASYPSPYYSAYAPYYYDYGPGWVQPAPWWWW